MKSALILSALIAAIASAATAQSPGQAAPYGRPWSAYPGGSPAAIADQHRYENERLRLQTQTNAAQARQQQAETRQRLLELQSARDTSSPSVPARPFVDPVQNRAAQAQADARREQTRQDVNQIDNWLDRPN
ncbi:hypothetical protein [Brevundimonas sp.]|jgi:hypothetical protein|uniref:hypothetical protein n=1 Tax=Brevundimonas sp. TaxID=1871086 RepID=UPI0037C070A3